MDSRHFGELMPEFLNLAHNDPFVDLIVHSSLFNVFRSEQDFAFMQDLLSILKNGWQILSWYQILLFHR